MSAGLTRERKRGYASGAGRPVVRPRPEDVARRRRLSLALVLRRPGERTLITALSLAAYMLAAVLVVLVDHSLIGDAWSRVANGYYVLFSRDPHLAAIGFVWNPLPSIAVLPFLPLKFVWPDMVATGFAGCIVSALCMAGAVWQLHAVAQEWQVRRSARVTVTLLFALNPMILYYGANGMSEAMFILTMMICIRYLARWSRSGQVAPLAVAGIAMAAAYLTRYEAAIAAIGAFAVVVILSALRRPGQLRSRVAEGIADGIVFAAPVATTFLAWAFASWLIVRDPFQQFTSVYGVVSQLAVAQSSVAQTTGQGTSSAYWWITHQILGLEPGILVLGLLGLVATLKGRHGITMPAVAILGSVVAFAVFGFLTGRTLGWLRYSISVIPLMSMLALAVLAPNPTAEDSAAAEAPPGAADETHWSRLRQLRQFRLPVGRRLRMRSSRAAGAAAVALLALAVPVGAMTMLDPGQNPAYGGEAFQLRPVLFPNEAAGQITPFGQYEIGRQAAQYLDALHLDSGQVLVDGAMGFPIILESRFPTQFITTSDRDFQQALLDPVSFGVKYLLVPEDVGYQSLDAINRAYPGIYKDGTTIAPKLVTQFDAGGNNWRLYQVSSSS
jgi:hypothetical protein